MRDDFAPRLTGSFSEGAAGNPTVAMVEAAYRHHGIAARYVNAEVPPSALADAVRGARAMGWAGFNLSMPHKVAVVELLDGLGASASTIGAVNCVTAEGGRLIGENTDGKGFVEALRAVRDPAGASVVMLGAGGAARAVAVELVLAGIAELTIVNRTSERAVQIAETLAGRLGFDAHVEGLDGVHRVDGAADIVVNASSVGLYSPDVCAPLDLDDAGATAVVADVVFSPVETGVLGAARARGLTTVDGLGMLVEQGAVAVRLWTGVDPDRAVMRAALAEAMGVA